MKLESLLWVSTAAYAFHMIEEFSFDWRGWARAVLKLPAEWPGFYVTNVAVLVLGTAAAMVGRDCLTFSLAFPAFMLINAVFFHLAPFAWTRGRFSPGLVTAVILFLPLGYLDFRNARETGSLSGSTIALSFVLGAALMAFPPLCTAMRGKPYFQQE